ncbi:hypothetical protein C2S53_003456 [Perilla frutescens var. hirtella]|uniref:Uncharacterized protein n=1 Tax=Perilla frutescens var. hirtella TaxID=608512 RepID=A0AAD4IRH2_PERFH|nr:hypothetical protein C2S53_003456 [Perilla frutescens var. hirtella]
MVRAFPATSWGYVKKGPILEKHYPTPSSSAVFGGGIRLGKGERVKGRRLTMTELLRAHKGLRAKVTRRALLDEGLRAEVACRVCAPRLAR